VSLDITASKTWYYDEKFGWYDTKDEIAGFTFSSMLNDYWGTYDFFIGNADDIIPYECDKLYIYNRKTLFKLKEKNKKLKLGEDVNIFLNSCINSGVEKIYVEIY